MPGSADILTGLDPSLATSQVEITIKYDGLDVNDGTMPIEDVISALRGFSNAYGKVAAKQDPNGQHQIRVAAINRSSFAVTILAWANEHKALLAASVSIASAIVATITKLIDLIKALKGKPPASVAVNGNNNTVVITTAGDNTQVIVPREIYELYQSKAIDGEIGKLVAPLREGKVEAVSISATDKNGPLEPVTITNSERGFFL